MGSRILFTTSLGGGASFTIILSGAFLISDVSNPFFVHDRGSCGCGALIAATLLA